MQQHRRPGRPCNQPGPCLMRCPLGLHPSFLGTDNLPPNFRTTGTRFPILATPYRLSSTKSYKRFPILGNQFPIKYTKCASLFRTPGNTAFRGSPRKRLFSLKLYQTGVPCSPVARGQPRPVRGRRAQPQAAAPWPPTAWAGLPTAALQRGTPLNPAVPRHGPRFEFLQKPENRQGLGVGHGQPQAVAHPRHRRTRARNPSCWMTEAAGARCAKARQGAQPRGSGRAAPRGERLRRGPEAGAVFIWPPLGA